MRKTTKYLCTKYQGFTLCICQLHVINIDYIHHIYCTKLENRKINIFLADDDEDDRGFFEEAISNLKINCNLIMVDDGEQAIEYFKNIKVIPEFIFLDINMPFKDGLECLKFINEQYPSRKCHIIILSTSIADKDVDFSYKHGASAYIQKPGSFFELIKHLDYCINNLSVYPDRDNFILRALPAFKRL